MTKRQNFSRFNQPRPCRVCGKNTTWSDANGYAGLGLCEACFDAATLENAHEDGYHRPDRDGFDESCPLCQAEREEKRSK
jgi:hypothetical protein